MTEIAATKTEMTSGDTSDVAALQPRSANGRFGPKVRPPGAREMRAGRRAATSPKERLLRLAHLDGRTRGSRMAKDIFERAVQERGGPERMNTVRLKSAEAYAVLTAM